MNKAVSEGLDLNMFLHFLLGHVVCHHRIVIGLLGGQIGEKMICELAPKVPALGVDKGFKSVSFYWFVDDCKSPASLSSSTGMFT